MEKRKLIKEFILIFIIAILISVSVLPAISGNNADLNEKKDTKSNIQVENSEEILVICEAYGVLGEPYTEIYIQQQDAENILDKIKELEFSIFRDPCSEETQELQQEIIIMAKELKLLPKDTTLKYPEKLINKIQKTQPNNLEKILPTTGRASEFFCNFASVGEGASTPVVILPRVIPFLLTPIPRVFMRWAALDGYTSCGGMRSMTGFMATGPHSGFALGFWGIGFSIFLPPVCAYGFFGYALFASITAEYIEFYPPNSPPVISQIDPGDGEVNVPLSLSELRFQIMDLDGDLMSYTVTTSPDIGSGSGNLVSDGIYSVDVSGLEDLTEYTWHVEVTDGMDITVGDYSFITEPIAPIVSNPIPYDGARYVSIDLSELSFYLKDYQGDPIDYTVETVPDIGSGSGFGVGEGTYSIPVSDLDFTTEYLWFVNASDGVYESRKVFGFQTELEMTFDPFAKGWLYRKEVTIDHNLVDSDLENFPVLISITDVDLRDKAQVDGDDILFMDGVGVATRLFHEIEDYDSSSGELVAWVNIPYLDSGSDTVFYVYYGNSESDCQQAPQLVWNQNFVGVWHLDEGVKATQLDSSCYGNDAYFVNSGADNALVSGIIGNCIQFNDGHDYYETTGADSSLDTGGELTFSHWIWVDSFHDHEEWVTKGNDWYTLTRVTEPINGIQMYVGNIVGGSLGGSSATWYYITCTVDSSGNYKYYEDGNLVNQHTGTSLSDITQEVGLGKRRESNRQPDGMLDEVRLSNIARSSTWILTEYSNQNDPSSFYNIGPEET